MAEKRGAYSYMADWLAQMGYSPDERMAGVVDGYWGWFTADNAWYHYRQRRNFRTFTLERETLGPASLAAETWSDLLMNERLSITSPDAAMARFIDERFSGFGLDSADFVSRAFALGTGGWAVDVRGVSGDGLQHPGASVEVTEYDATQIIPLTYSARDCQQCAFASRVEVGGRDYDQCQAHVLRGGTYHIVTQLFEPRSHVPVRVEGVAEDLDTGSPHKTFSLVRPAVPNKHFSYCAMGASVFDGAVGAIKAVDEALTSLLTHLRVAKPRMFVDREIVDVVTETDASGKKVRRYAAFGEADDTVFMMRTGNEGAEQMRVVQPDPRVEENTEAINTGLKLLSLKCGLGNGYWSWDMHNGITTATEVVSDSAALAKSLKRHQNNMTKSIRDIVRGVAGVCVGLGVDRLDPCAEVDVDYDDSVITDTQTDKSMALAEIAALGVPELKQRYLVRWCGFTEEEAAAAVPSEQVVDEGY